MKRNTHILYLLGFLSLIWAGSVLLSLKLGVVHVSFADVWSSLTNRCRVPENASSAQTLFILCSIRFPRVLLSSLAGFILSLCGAVMQGLFRTPLADPYLLGILGGSTSGAALIICLGLGQSLLFLPLGAFLGGMLAVILVSLAAAVWTKNPTEPNTLILAGIAFSALFSALTSCFIYMAPQGKGAQSLIFWLLGSFSRSDWSFVEIVSALTLLISPVIFLSARGLNLLSLGDAMAEHLGQSPGRLRKLLLLLTTLLTATVVASVGPIGFVGLLVPHSMRLLVGPDHRYLLPVSALGGAIFLTWCDTLARVLFAPNLELPIGIITAFLGAPCLLFLLLRRASAR